MSTTDSPASIAWRGLGPIERADATPSAPVVFTPALDRGRRDLADIALPSVKRTA